MHRLCFSRYYSALMLAMLITCLPAVSMAGSGYVGSDACMGCHEKYATDFKSNIHSHAGSYAEGFQGCESCHGPGEEHASAGDPSKIRNPKKLKSEETNAICLTCHTTGMVALWAGSAHESRNVACTNCHSVHGGYKKLLAADNQLEVCAKCHGDVKAQVWKSSHHPIREGKMTCTSCHNPHGTVAEKLIAANTINDKCFECHAEKRGPFLYEHKPVTESCINCHTPHGSNYNKLLVKKSIYLCQSCHSGEFHPGTMYAVNPASPGANTYERLANNRALYRDCLNCHANIHGSNHPSGATFLR